MELSVGEASSFDRRRLETAPAGESWLEAAPTENRLLEN